ncbi:MAG TPA: hypothetical protein DCW83_14340 [Saprospirales bacterium]|nr:hypothetical protein [Saprospirales bacterium]
MKLLFPKAERLEGVDGSLLKSPDILPFTASRDWRDPFWNRRITKGEIGCVLSHYKLWKKCVELNEPILILEDDVDILDDRWEEKVEEYLDYDLLYVGRKHITGVKKSIDSNIETPGFSYWLSSYILSPAFAAELINYCDKNPLLPADEIVPLIAGEHRDLVLNSPLQDFKVAAFKKDLIAQKVGSFSQSDTETPEDIWEDYSFHILTVATDESKASKLLESPHNIINLGKDVLWEGGTMQGPGGGQKVNLIREGLSNYNDNDIVMFVDGYDTFIHASEDEILKRYFGFRAEVVFSAEKTCWPDKSIADRFPETGGYRYLNSGTFIGTVGTLKKIFADQVENHSDDQLYCQKQYLSGNFNITLDYESYIFFCLAGLEKNCSYNQTNDFVINNETNCTSCIVHGNGGEYTKESFNSLYYQINEYKIYIPTQEYKDLHVLDRDILLLYNFLSEDYCEELIRVADEFNEWKQLPNDKFPGQEVRLKKLYEKYYNIYEKAYFGKFVPAVEKYWKPLSMHGIRDLFVIKYERGKQTSLRLHHDMSLVSGSMKLNNDYTGGVLKFPRQGVDNLETPVGSVIIWPGQVTHGHECTEVTSGTKYGLTLWTSRMDEDIYAP